MTVIANLRAFLLGKKNEREIQFNAKLEVAVQARIFFLRFYTRTHFVTEFKIEIYLVCLSIPMFLRLTNPLTSLKKKR